jgi:bifunctional oligoribonuclease and PAP phosphatase NrnA
MGSALGLAGVLQQLGHTVTVISPTNWAYFLEWMPGCKAVINYEAETDKGNAALDAAEWVFCLDFNVLHRTRKMEPKLLSLTCTKVLVDHHEQPQTEYFDYGISNTAKSSTSEMIYDIIAESGHKDKIDIPVAECLYAGLIGDTGSFRFPAATARVHEMAAVLKATGMNHTRVHEDVYDNFLENRLRFIGFVLVNRMEIFYQYNTALISVSRTDLQRFDIKTGDTEGLVNYPLTIQGIKMAALIIDRDEEIKCSFRSKGDFDVNSFARRYFEGGGHHNASGGRSTDTLEKTVRRFKDAIRENEALLQ